MREDEYDEVRTTEIVERNGSTLSWSAVIAGLVLMVALGWLFFLLGSALGVTIADASDADALGRGFGIAATVWLFVSALASFFFGGLLAGRLASTPDRGAGMLHGVTLWGLGTALLMLFGYWGVTGLLQTGQAVAQGAASVAGEAGSALGGAITDSAALDRVKDELARQVSEASARASAAAPTAAEPPAVGAPPPSALGGSPPSAVGGSPPSAVGGSPPSAVGGSPPSAVGGSPPSAVGAPLSEAALREAALAIEAGDAGRAESALVRDGALTQEQARRVVQNVTTRPRTGMPDATTEIQNSLREQARSVAMMEAPAPAAVPPAPVTQAEARRAVEQLDAEALTAIAAPLLRGDREAAKRALAARTALEEREVDAIVTGVMSETRGEARQLRGEVAEATEAASSYAQAGLWASFVSGALALVASIAGASLGAGAARRAAYRVRRVAT